MEQLPAWDNTSEYKAIYSEDFNQDIAKAEALVEQIESLNSQLATEQGDEKVAILQKISELKDAALVFVANTQSYVYFEQSLDMQNSVAQKAFAQTEALSSRWFMACKASEVFLSQCDDQTLQRYLQADHTKSEAFFWSNERRMKDFLLKPEEETLLSQFRRFGCDSWGNLYSSLAGSLKVTMPSGEVIGAAQAAGNLRSADADLRKNSWLGLQKSWKSVEIPCASILNNLAGYRHEEYAKRSHTKKLHFLDVPLFNAKIERKTLDAMMGTLEERISVPHRALASMAKAFGKSQLDPWDLLAASPKEASDAKISFAEGIAMIHEAFASVSPQMGDFVSMMVKNKWIEGRVLPNKRSGAYCGGFLKSETTRVFQSYMGSMKDVSTLAHELGHAYHSWVLRGLPQSQKHYPMTLAETASIFSETVLSEALMVKADPTQKFGIAWEDAADAVSLLVNIPARFEFEKNFYEARLKGPLSADELSDMTDKAWRKWYGNHLSQTESQYWMTKLHFSISQVSFYNYPYTFGYLFGLGIYAQREKLGAGFHKAYVDILQDTGRMTAEDLVQKHLGADIRKPDFWRESLRIVEAKVARFEKLV